jgi:hypothetical protein
MIWLRELPFIWSAGPCLLCVIPLMAVVGVPKVKLYFSWPVFLCIFYSSFYTAVGAISITAGTMFSNLTFIAKIKVLK